MHFKKVAEGMVHEHFFGDKTTRANAEHSRAALLLMKGLCAFYDEYRRNKDMRGCECQMFYRTRCQTEGDLDRMPVPDDLCWLIAIVMHLDRLAPLLPKAVLRRPWQETPQFKADFVYAKKKAEAFVEKLKKTNQDDLLAEVCGYFRVMVHPFNCLNEERAVETRCFCKHGGHADLPPSVDGPTM